jgi:hypothetical protein
MQTTMIRTIGFGQKWSDKIRRWRAQLASRAGDGKSGQIGQIRQSDKNSQIGQSGTFRANLGPRRVPITPPLPRLCFAKESDSVVNPKMSKRQKRNKARRLKKATNVASSSAALTTMTSK